MPLSAPSPQPPHEGPLDRQAQVARHRAILNELIELGADMVRIIHREADAEVAPLAAGEPRPAMGELGVAFDRITRCVRRTIWLEHKLAEPVPVVDPARPRVVARQRIIRQVEDAIQREANGAEARSLRAELLDRLDSPDLEDDIGDRPVGEIIAEICNDLGLNAIPGSHLWARRRPADLVVLRALAAAATRPGGLAACAGVPAEGTPLVSGTPSLPGIMRCRDP